MALVTGIAICISTLAICIALDGACSGRVDLDQLIAAVAALVVHGDIQLRVGVRAVSSVEQLVLTDPACGGRVIRISHLVC